MLTARPKFDEDASIQVTVSTTKARWYKKSLRILWQQLSGDKFFSALPEHTTGISHSGDTQEYQGDQQDTEQL